MTAQSIAHSTGQLPPRFALFVLAIMVAGCAQDGSLSGISTAAINPQEAKSNPLCLTLTSQIEALNKEGIPEKVSKAAQKKYKMKPGDFAKADELNKANAEFQTKCSEYPPANVAAAPSEPNGIAQAANKAADQSATQVAKAKPPVPSQKPVSASLAAQTTPGQQTTTGSIATTSPQQP
jgi:hypothetical protein